MKQSTPYRPQRSALEEKYFRQKEAELLTRLQAARQQAEELRGLAQETGIANEDVLAVLHEDASSTFNPSFTVRDGSALSVMAIRSAATCHFEVR